MIVEGKPLLFQGGFYDMMYYVLIGSGAALNLISLAAFQKLQIPMTKLAPSRPFSRVGSGSIISHCSISLPVTLGMPENYRTESIIFDVAKVNLSFNAILGRPGLYQFMDIDHHGYLVLKIPSPNGIIKICGDRSAGVCAGEASSTGGGPGSYCWPR
jgi:hypothetical protein